MAAIFALLGPDAGHSGDTLRFDAEIRQGVDQNLLDGADECAHIALPCPQIHDRIRDDLARPVVSDIAAAIALVKFDAGAPQRFFRGEQIFRMAVAPDGDHVRVFDEQQMVNALPLLALRRDLLTGRSNASA